MRENKEEYNEWCYHSIFVDFTNLALIEASNHLDIDSLSLLFQVICSTFHRIRGSSDFSSLAVRPYEGQAERETDDEIGLLDEARQNLPQLPGAATSLPQLFYSMAFNLLSSISPHRVSINVSSPSTPKHAFLTTHFFSPLSKDIRQFPSEPIHPKLSRILARKDQTEVG